MKHPNTMIEGDRFDLSKEQLKYCYVQLGIYAQKEAKFIKMGKLKTTRHKVPLAQCQILSEPDSDGDVMKYALEIPFYGFEYE